MTGRAGWGLLARSAVAVFLTVSTAPTASALAVQGGAQAEQVASAQVEQGAEPEHAAGAQVEHGGEVEHGAQAEHAAGAQEEHGGEGEHGAEEHHGPTWQEYLFKWINFGLLVALLWWLLVDSPKFVTDIFGFPGLRTYLKNRREAIVEARQLAEERRHEAERLLQESAARLDEIEASVAALLDEAREDAERERQRAESEGQRQAERIKEMALRELRAETLAARRELRAFVADLAIDGAEEILRERISPEVQDELVRQHLARLGERVA